MQTLRRLVTGTDFSEGAEQSLEMALALATVSLARVTLVHVCEFDAGDLDDARLLECREALSEVVARYRHCGVELTGVLRHGRPWEKLDNVAVEVGASLIVIGRQGRGRALELGSVAERLVRCASRPVLTVPRSL